MINKMGKIDGGFLFRIAGDYSNIKLIGYMFENYRIPRSFHRIWFILNGDFVFFNYIVFLFPFATILVEFSFLEIFDSRFSPVIFSTVS